MPFTFKQFHIDDEQCGMAVSTDAVILGAWAELTQSQHILDIGAGSGLLSLMAAQRSLEQTKITAVELDTAAANACKHNIEQSPWPQKVQLFHGAIQDFQQQFDKSITPLFDHIICNPPYFEQGTQAKNSARADARHTNTLSFAELQKAISQLLAPQGNASIILPQQSLASFIQQLNGHGLFVAKHLEIISAEGKSPNRSILVVQHILTTEQQTFENTSKTQYLQMAIRNKQSGYSQTMIDLCRPFYLKL
ncbi:tRNA1(Val) (adenine(37)-N6)-methyltransferase [Shewanella ulleungensis]|jgi:tRNA1Val (adenine37-N6)-methyltransferase|uniref:tRNA1(Val) (adenine(37)-N6)-methyltransferase n=1 Tax=Shewanella ulleungensis TaxID=2282699 RepID=A0ABQ2QX62_9GAMM|nr:methyltransferase [Shewanella ulleungensis]MCL1151375.1 methyltransferase [Shewanella ulleungensis]GGP97580.1 tRNA1(Val) (adenine(37)-N6)-methyltransferase [Shewanella ulleungensis]